MATPDKLPLLKAAFRLLVDELRPQDRVAIAVYAGAAGLVLPPTSGREGGAILAALDSLQAGGSTAGGAGLQLAYSVARDAFAADGINRVILATDGDFNVGASSRGELVRMIEHEREAGIFLSVLGFGSGNLKDSQMEQLADRGNGNYAYIDSLQEARKVLVREAGGTLVAIARDVKIQVEWNPLAVAAYRLIGYENRALAAQDFNDDRKDAGEIGAGHTVTALYEVVQAGEGDALPGVDPLRYQQPRRASVRAQAGELLTVKLRYKAPEGGASRLIERPVRADAAGAASANLRWAAAVAAFGLVLRDSEHKGEASFDLVEGLAEGALGDDPHGDRAEFVELVRQAAALADGPAQITHR
jgi:Ca-activated chloride channel family protein